MARLDFICIVAIFHVVCSVKATKYYQVDRYALCDGVTDSAVKFSDMQIVGKKQAISLTGTMEAIRNVKPPVQFRLSVNRCDLDKTNCEPFDTITLDDVCPIFNENHFVKAYMGFFSPPLSCPMQIGKHTAKNTNLDMRVFEGFSIGNAHWQTEMRIVDGNNKTEICVWTEITITEKEM
nr:uncharacterized protein LOC109621937 [Aedes albopictus]